MKFLSTLTGKLRVGIVNALGGTFDSASDNPQRTSTLMFPFDSKKEIAPRERRELVKKHRSLRNNLGFVRGMVNTTARLVVGKGIMPMPKSGDPDFNRRALAYWKRATKGQTFDVSGQDTEVALQRLVMREMIVDGEIFAIRVFDGFGHPQRQLIKTEQVGDPTGRTSTENWQDGILLNSLRRPLKYGILQEALPGQPGTRFKPVEAQYVQHVFDRERATQSRGLPWGYTGLNHGVDVIDIAAFEKVSHKINNAIIASMTTADGKTPQNMDALLAAAMAASNGVKGDTKAAKDTKQGARYLDLHGSMIPIFKAGENMQFFPSRNSMNTVEFAGWLLAQYAQGFGAPVEWIVGITAGGANVRGNNDLGARFIDDCRRILVDDWCQPNWQNIIGTGLLAYLYPRDYPLIEPLEPPRGWDGWDTVTWRGPKDITVDRGREGKLYVELVRSGMMTKEEWWTLQGEDPDEAEDAIAKETAKNLKRWLDEGLPEDMFWRKQFGQNLPAQAVQPGQTEDNPDAPPNQ
jgi:capsid protein